MLKMVCYWHLRRRLGCFVFVSSSINLGGRRSSYEILYLEICMCKTCPIMSRVRVPARGRICRGSPGHPSVPLPRCEEHPVLIGLIWRLLCNADSIKTPLRCLGFAVVTCFAVYLLHWTACVAQFLCCGRTLKCINDCCSSSCRYRSLYFYMWGWNNCEAYFRVSWKSRQLPYEDMSWKEKDFFISERRNAERGEFQAAIAWKG